MLALSAACLVAIATRLSAGTTLITCAALAAVATTLALMRGFASSLFGTTAAAFVMTTAFMLAFAAFGFLLARSCLLTASAGTFLACTAFSIRSTVAGSIAAATILAGADFLLGTCAVGFLAALGSVFAAVL